MNDKKYVLNKKSIIATIILLLFIVIGFSYAFFTNKIFSSKESFRFGEGLNIEFILDGGDGLSYSYDPLKMTNHANEKYIDSDTSNGTVTLVNHSDYDNVTCEYEVWFKADNSFGEDFSIVANKNNKTEFEKNLKEATDSNDIKITDAYITVGKKDTEEGSKIDNWNFNYRHYILKEDIQNDNIGKEYNGHIYFKAIRCFEGKGPGENLLDSCNENGNIESCFKNLYNSSPDDVGDGVLLKHTKELDNSAEDDGYRYSGNQPDNYICFGAGSEEYNWGITTECPIQNKYRIIGYVPVIVNGKKEFRVKVIKAEYLTEEEFGDKLSDAWYEDELAGLKRTELPLSGIPGYAWDKSYSNNWEKSTLYASLNSDEYKNNAFGSKWIDKIENVKWNVGGSSDIEFTAKEMYEEEMKNQGTTATVDNLIGLMYAYDYGFASSSENWIQTLWNYNNSGNIQNRENNWLFNAIDEWMISRNSNNNSTAIFLDYYGCANSTAGVSYESAIRPVFYLKSNISFVMSDETTDGSREHPYKIDIPNPTLLDRCGESGNLIECFQNVENLNIDVGDGKLIHHTASIETSAGDDGYRYAGNEPNNYLCLGKGSAKYNRGEEETCPVKNKYRIIGYVPVTVGSEKKNLVKVIKAEYLTDDEFKTSVTKANFNNTYTGLKRVETIEDGIAGYQYNDNSESNEWQNSTLYSSLNSGVYINRNFGNAWRNKIQMVFWNVGGGSYDLTPKEIYNDEIKEEGATVSVQAQIGLMYVHDYGFASSEDNWSHSLYDYDDNGTNNRESNWLYNAVSEWTISPTASYPGYAVYIKDDGDANTGGNVNSNPIGVRPVFYLTDDVSLVTTDSTANGSKNHPFRLANIEEENVTLLDKCGNSGNLIECFKNVKDENIYVGDGELIHHTEELEYSAGDNGYRYAGNQPNNYICFGKGSEKYNWGEETACPVENKYRIIGYIPVTLADGSSTSLVKVVKAEYVGPFSEYDIDTASYDANFNLRRIEGDPSNIFGTIWGYENLWAESEIYNYITNETYFYNTFGSVWQDKMANVKWNSPEVNSDFYTPKEMYGYEKNPTSDRQFIDYLGLMSAYDYGFATSNVNNIWTFTLPNYHFTYNTENNWLFNGIDEWLITATNYTSNGAFYIAQSGSLSAAGVNYYPVKALRISFYLNKDVSIVMDDYNTDGSKEHPFRIADVPERGLNLLDVCPDSGNIVECFKNLDNNQKQLDFGIGELVHHTTSISTGASDNSYRYSGNQPNNYICFGNGSEAYNRGDPGAICDIKNKYRIIGYVPVTLADGKTNTSLVKVIKAEYLTEQEFITPDGINNYGGMYFDFRKIETQSSELGYYNWNNPDNQTWRTSELRTALNSANYLNKSFGTWQSKIESVTWNLAGSSDYQITPSQMYQNEIKGTGKTVTKSDQIGVMYVHDYAFASKKSNWGITLDGYNNQNNFLANWLFNGVDEWTISGVSDWDGAILSISSDGGIMPYSLDYGMLLRPTFYLKSTTNFVKDNSTDGSKEHPFRISIS